MLHDRVLVDVEGEAEERRSGGGIVIPAAASVAKRATPVPEGCPGLRL
jgi:chaperonin GroES